ncbi:MAG: hypothetical protein K2X77_00400 [Candidatus Obscuribacterales bacterium]|jgi:hypothetical protein|nr:hypothetical protein [Candidatus Obscuribacterales bacterium]
MSERASDKEADYKKGEGEPKNFSAEASDRFRDELRNEDLKQSFSKPTDSSSSLPLFGKYISKVPDFTFLDEMKKGVGASQKGAMRGDGDKGGPEKQADDNKLYPVDEKGNRISGNVAIPEKGGVAGSGDKGGPEKQPDDNKLYEVDENGNRISGNVAIPEKGGVAGSGDKGGPEKQPDDNKLYEVDENGNRISAVDVWGTRDLGLPPSDSFDPSRHGDRQPLVTGDTFFRLRGNQFIDREDGSRFMLHPDGSFLIQGADEVGVSMDNGVTTIRFRNGDEIEFDSDGIRRVTGRGREARRK